MIIMRFALALVFMTLTACSSDRDLPIPDIDCHTGLYQSASGEFLSLSPLSSGGYRWRMLDGTTGALNPETGISTQGWTDDPDGQVGVLGTCGDDQFNLGPAEALQTYQRVPLEVTDTRFDIDGTAFSGRLIWPVDVERTTLVVHVHGSEASSAVRRYAMPYLLASQGIASFVYDKRGTGQSGDKYTQDFYRLAADARAALAEARRMAGDRITQTGYIGTSQGGWVAPLAASEDDADFVVLLYGMAVNALFEDRSQVINDLAAAGWGPEEQAKGAEIADAAGVIMASNFQTGYEEFASLRALYRDEPWYQDIEGEFTGQFVSAPPIPAFIMRVIGPSMGVGTSWDYEPVPVLRALQAEQLWVIGGADTEAPPEETIMRITALQDEGRPIDMVTYPDADHGMILIETSPDGEVRNPGYVENYYRLVAAWIDSRDLSYSEAAGAEVTTRGRSD